MVTTRNFGKVRNRGHELTIEVHRAVAPQENKCKAGKNGHYRYEIYRYLDSQGRSGDSLSAKVTSSLPTNKTKILVNEKRGFHR
jgi:hypothetical protein